MLAIGIRYLTKYAVANNLARQRPEWPPHPGRVFMAMAAGHFETGADPAERAALEWLESVPPPAMRASDASERSATRAYVPVNDQLGSKSQPPDGSIPREKADRAFPRVRPQDDSVYLIWSATPSAEIRQALERVCSKVTRVGHSSSAVQAWVVNPGTEPAPDWLPGADFGEARLRVPANGTLRELENAFNGQAIQEYETLAEALAGAKGRSKAALKQELAVKFPDGRPEYRRPQLVHWQGYRRSIALDAEPIVDGPFENEFLILSKTEGPALGLESALQLTGALRNTAMNAAGKNVPEWLSGHDAAGRPSPHVHVAFFPLPYVGYDYADGHVLGLGIALPSGFAANPDVNRESDIRRCLGPLFFDADTGEERLVKLWRNDLRNRPVWEWVLERETRERPPLTLQRLTWTKPSRRWASVTPVVLHHFPRKRSGDQERIVREAFATALLPQPDSIKLSSISSVGGAGHAMALPSFTEGGPNLCRLQIHVDAVFNRPVRGPMLVGRGRFRGYGLFRPMPEEVR